MQETWFFELWQFGKILAVGAVVAITVLFLKKIFMKIFFKEKYGDGGAIGFLISLILISVIVSAVSLIFE